MAWDINFDPQTNLVDVRVGYLRRKLGEPVIETVRGARYRLQGPASTTDRAGQARADLTTGPRTARPPSRSTAGSPSHKGTRFRQGHLSGPVGAENLRHQAIFVNHAPGAIAPPAQRAVLTRSIVAQAGTHHHEKPRERLVLHHGQRERA